MSNHSPTCASGARAEQRGPCDCGAIDARPWRVRFTDTMHEDRRLIEFEIDRPLTTTEALDLALSVQEMTRIEGERWARADMRKGKKK